MPMLQSPHLRIAPALRPLTTAHLAQTMALLELSASELEQKVEAELARNPALELKDPRRCHVATWCWQIQIPAHAVSLRLIG